MRFRDRKRVGENFVDLMQSEMLKLCRFAWQFGGGESAALDFPNRVFHHPKLICKEHQATKHIMYLGQSFHVALGIKNSILASIFNISQLYRQDIS